MSPENYVVGFSKELDFRPVEFVNLHSNRSCCLCKAVPQVTFLLGCSHAFCELCYQNLLCGDRRCPLDEVDFEEDDVTKLAFKPKHLQRKNVRCFNSKNGCGVVGTVEEIQSHFFNECTYYAVPCTKCKCKVLRRDIASHYGASCHQGGISSSSFTGVQLPIRGSLLDLVKKTSVSVENVEGKLSTVGYQLNGYAVEIDSFKEMAIKNEQLLKSLLENQERVAADVGNINSNMQQQGHDQGRVSEQLKRLHEIQMKSYSDVIDKTNDSVTTTVKAVNENVEQISERVGNLTHILQQISATLSDVKGMEERMNPLLQCSKELTKFMNADIEAREQMPVVKAVLGISKEMGDVAKHMQQQRHDQGRINEQLKRLNELLSAIEMQMKSYSDAIDKTSDSVITNVKAMNGNVERVSERARNLTAILQRVNVTLNVVKGMEEKLNPLLQCSEQLTKFMNADDEAREKMPVVKAVLGTSMEMCSVVKHVSTLYSFILPQYTEAFFHVRDFQKMLEEARYGNLVSQRSSEIFVLCRYSVRLEVLHAKTCSLTFRLCHGSTDSLLEWPFRIPFTCRFVHPKDSTKDIVCDTIYPVNECKVGYGFYRRPATENIAVLCEPAASPEDLRENGFISEDSFCVGIKLHQEMAW